MKVKTSITLDDRVLAALDRLGGKKGNRSSLIEQAVREFIVRWERRKRDRRELELLNRHADELNAEAEDVLEWQVDT